MQRGGNGNLPLWPFREHQGLGKFLVSVGTTLDKGSQPRLNRVRDKTPSRVLFEPVI